MKDFISKDSRDGKYYHYYQGTDGKRKRKCLGTSDEDIAKKMIEQPVEVTVSKKESIKLSELREVFMNYANVNLTRGTVGIYKNTFMNMFDILKDVAIDKITVMDIERYKSIRIKKVKPATANIEIRNMKTIFNLAVEWEFITKNPADKVKQFSELEREIQFFTDEQFEQLLSVIENDSHRLLLQVGYYTGCRLGEVLSLEWSNIDLKNRVIKIINKATFKTKTGKIRYIPINDKLYELLKNGGLGHLFTIHHPHAVAKMFKQYVVKAGLPYHFHYHHLRHTFITNLIRKGTSIYKVKTLSGHSQISTTERYTHLVTDDLRDCVNLL